MQLRQCIYGSASDGLALVFQASEKLPRYLAMHPN